jgi:UDP-N-acetylglucosamine transferase subunit ALG13
MIFVTVGTQFPFDRLIAAVDKWVEDGASELVFAQTGVGGYQPRHFQSAPFLSPQLYEQYAQGADVIVSHAGMGSIITALRYSKPIVVVPRIYAFGEHRNDHQTDTVEHIAMVKGIFVCEDVSGLAETIKRARALGGGQLSPFAEPELIRNIANWLTS